MDIKKINELTKRMLEVQEIREIFSDIANSTEPINQTMDIRIMNKLTVKHSSFLYLESISEIEKDFCNDLIKACNKYEIAAKEQIQRSFNDSK